MTDRGERDRPGAAGPTGPAAPGGWFRFEPPIFLRGGDLDQFIGRVLPGARAVGVEYIDEGVVNSNYRVEVALPAGADGPGGGSSGRAAHTTLLLRLSRSDEGPLREGAIAIQCAERIPALGVRRLLGSERGEAPEPHRRSLFTWVPGRGLDSLECSVSDAALDRVARSLAAALARVHSIRLPAFGRFDPGLNVRSSPHRPPARRWADDIAHRVAVRLENPAHGLDAPSRDRLRVGFARRLSSLWTAPIPAALVHGDLSPGNILVGPDEAGGAAWRLAGLIDWEMARAADPAADFASLRFELDAGRPGFAAAVESAYRSDPATAAWAGPDGLWDVRVALASLPILLDARMVAVRRRSAGRLRRIDALIEAALPT